MRQIVFTNPRISNSAKLTTRAFVEFYYDNVRVKEYTGNCIGLKIFPGRAKTIAERTSLLKLLCKEITRALVEGRYRKEEEAIIKDPSTQETLATALSNKLKGKLSNTYKRDLTYVYDQFIGYLSDSEKEGPLKDISTNRIEEFLYRFNSSNTYYMNKRTDLGALFSAAGRVLNLRLEAVRQTPRKKAKAKLHEAYDEGQVKPLLSYLEQAHPRLYICCMLTYSSWLRPHIEIRQLRREHFDDECTFITLSGDENKGGRVRKVYVPHYAQKPLKEILENLKPSGNIFSGESKALNADYFKTAWTRLRPDLLDKGLIRPKQTIYSFRHTAAVQFYRRAKDVYLLQKLMGHQSVMVTMKYLRSLGEMDEQELIDAAPEL